MSDKIFRQKQHFDHIAESYLTARRHPNHLLLKDLIWRDFLAQHSELKKPQMRVLEAMCGFAEGKDILERTLDVVVDYMGIDYSDYVINTLRTTRPSLHVEQHDVTKFKSDARYDMILLIGGLHHVAEAAPEVVRRLSMHLMPGGHFISLEPTHGNRLFEKVRGAIYRRNSLFDDATERAFGIDEYFDLFRSADFELLDAMYPGLLSYVLYYNPDAFPLLNRGGARAVRFAYAIDRPFMRTAVGRMLSFATLTLWRKR